MSWSNAEERVSKSDQQDGLWVRLANDGDSAVVVFRGEPHVREVHWDGQKYADGPGPDGKASIKVSANVIVNGEAKVLEMNKSTFKDVLKVRAKYGLDNWSFEIKRSGEAGNAKTTYSILPEAQLTAAQKAEFFKVPLHDLAALYSGEKGGKDDFNSYKGKDDKPSPPPAPQTTPLIDDATANTLIAGLKTATKEQVKSFLDTFGIAKVRELKASDSAAALKFVADLTSAVEDDPFA